MLLCKCISLNKIGGGSGKLLKIRKLTFNLFARLSLSLDKIGCGSEKLLKIHKLTFKLFARLSLSLDKIGCGSEKCVRNNCVLSRPFRSPFTIFARLV